MSKVLLRNDYGAEVVTTQPLHDKNSQRKVWMATLAKSLLKELEEVVRQLPEIPSYHFLRSPETGLTMVRGRIGSTGDAFNLGEMTLTRCVVQLDDMPTDTGNPVTGFGYVGGRSHRHAELAALCDALLQHPSWHDIINRHVITPLQMNAQNRREKEQRQTEATRVNFFTMARAETLERS